MLVLMQDTGHDPHIVGVLESLAEVGEQVGGRLDARPVVLVEHQKARSAGRRLRLQGP